MPEAASEGWRRQRRQRSMRLAYFARGLDGLYLSEVAGCEAFALLRANSPEEGWAGPLVPRERALLYRLRGHDHDPYPATGDALRDSDVARVLRRHRIGALLLSSPFSPEIRAWSQRYRVRILAADYDQQRRLEDKLWFDRFLARHGIPRPESAVVVAGRRPSLALRVSVGPVVVQRADSLGGEGTYFLESEDEWPALAERLNLPRGERCLLRRFVTGRPLGITVFVAPGLVALSAARQQCYYPPLPGQDRRLFAGIQWLRASELLPRLREQIDGVFQQLGELLYRRRFFGFANFDFIADAEGRVWVIECNPRMSAATPQLLARPELSGGLPLGTRFLQGFLRPWRWPRQFQFSPLPQSEFAGATLDLASQEPSPRPVRRGFPSGPLRTKAGPATLFSLAARGQTAEPETTLGMILADFPLYDFLHNDDFRLNDAAGALNSAGRRLLTRFRYT